MVLLRFGINAHRCHDSTLVLSNCIPTKGLARAIMARTMVVCHLHSSIWAQVNDLVQVLRLLWNSLTDILPEYTNTGTPLHRAPLGQPIGSARGHASRSQIPTTTQRTHNANLLGSVPRASTTTRQQFPAPTGRSTATQYGLQAGMKIGGNVGSGQFVQRPASYAGGAYHPCLS